MAVLISILTSSLGRTLAIAAACFIAGFVVCWRWQHRERTFDETFAVASVANGATFEVKAGLLGRRSRLVTIDGITAPGLNDPQGPESRDNLQALAGETIRVETKSRILGTGTVVGQCFGETGADLGLAQLKAGLATCQTGASKAMVAAQKEAQTARRGLWTAKDNGSHWWHFSVAASEVPEPIPLSTEKPKMSLQMIGDCLLIAVAIVVMGWILVYFTGSMLSQTTAGKDAVKVVDTTAEVAAYTGLTAIRYMPAVQADPNAVASCEYLLTAVMKWPSTTAGAAATGSSASKS